MIDNSVDLSKKLDTYVFGETIADTIPQFLKNKDTDLRMLSALHKHIFSGCFLA